MEYIQIQFEGTNEAQNEILVALLDNIGFDGFEENIGLLKACIPAEKFDEEEFNAVIDVNRFNYSKSVIKKENWNANWESGFTPIAVNFPNSDLPFAYLKANFHPANDLYKYNIEVTPKMSFGTGHHATTYLMVQQMSAIDFTNKTVIDFGTGTGVLAILAQKMGAKHTLAIDCDDWSIENTIENIEANECSDIQVLKEFTIPAGEQADIILANINLNIITDNIQQIRNACLEHTTILFSGIMLHDEANIVNLLVEENFSITEIYKKDTWMCILAGA
jgi:ribosomal protein L11 methyltransferase